MNKRIVLTGGGTAGHVIPHLALLPYLRQRQWQVTYIGSRHGIEKQLADAADVPFRAIASGKLRRYFSFRNLSDMFKVGFGIWQSLWLLLSIRPKLVFSKGGYVSVPVVIAASLLRIKVVTHESDLSPGLATRIIARFATEVWTAFDETQVKARKVQHVGIPIRDELRQGDVERGRQMCGFKEGRRTLLIMGGSLGSQRINNVVATIVAELVRDYQVIHILGAGNEPSLSHSRYRVFPFVNKDFNHLLRLADMVISRAGANSIFEFLMLCKPMLLIPLDAGSRGDQIENAACFARKGFAQVLVEQELNGASLLSAIDKLERAAADIKAKQREYCLQANNDAIARRLGENFRKMNVRASKMKITIIDHYDSFTHNIDMWLRSNAPQVQTDIIKYDDDTAMSALQRAPNPLVLSAGPHSPTAAQPTIDLLTACQGKVAVLGICLGFQIICAWLGLTVRHSSCPQHGKRRKIYRCIQDGLLADLPMTFSAAAYNSLAVPRPTSLPPHWHVSAVSAEDELQAIELQGEVPICGVQFHPESFLDQHSTPLLQRWLKRAQPSVTQF